MHSSIFHAQRVGVVVVVRGMTVFRHRVQFKVEMVLKGRVTPYLRLFRGAGMDTGPSEKNRFRNVK
jgi:hypothetical protein